MESPDRERVALRVERFDAVEPMLAALREAGCRIEEMELLHADLEDVFISIMRESRI
jgi:ABC-2 type transport system ATP-binding protein